MSKNPFRILFSKGTLLNRLLRKYAFVMLSLTTIAAVIISMHTWRQNQRQAENAAKEALQTTSRMLDDKTTLSRIIKDQLLGNTDKIENVTTYLTKPIDEYLMYLYQQQNESKDLLSFSNQIKDMYVDYEELQTIYIVLNQVPEYFESSIYHKGGSIKKGTPDLMNAFYIKMPITQGGSELGSLFVGFQKKNLESSLENLNTFGGLSLYMISGTANRLYTFHDSGITKRKIDQQEKAVTSGLQKNSSLPIETFSDQNIVQYQKLTGEYRILALLDRQKLTSETLKSLAPLIVGVILLDNLLLLFLYQTFKRYSQQIEIIMHEMSETSKGNLDTRIDLDQTEYELRDLSEGINHMLDSLDRYVEDIYKLKIKQQDAHMRALQAQINPHFLYNTLEYIRMYALSEGSEELADVVYAFSALLRNNITQEQTTTLAEELSFCEKYVYLYQMRYPNRVAYHFTIEPSLKELQLPKFAIQPLVENYFKHGIDFTRHDNALSVKAYCELNKVVIQIKDNGKGITEEQLQLIEQRLADPKRQTNQSIGIQNVYERLHAYFGKSCELQLYNNKEGGLTIQITFRKVEAGHV
ncbi:HAMP domain protein [Enterococcus faecalis 13-SD-W-01]|nr:HAMP domain protein [Enterococcus faecalis 13-SD-W-01]